ncbi:MAG: tRNA (adenosine(37)-N6)-dimethylallyltransferase MiaA [Rhodothermales bacterium]
MQDTKSSGTYSYSSPPIIAITGPTGVGKTTLSLALAKLLKGEIVSVDSRQIYKELNIGTAKPSPEELAEVPHHFISESSIQDPISSGQFAGLAEIRINEILQQGKVPILVGGSTLYLHALQHGMADIPEVDPEIRNSLEERLKKEGGEKLYQELIDVDPVVAGTMDPTKSQRLIRALEVYHGTGRPLSFFHAKTQPPRFKYKTAVLYLEREVLYNRIDLRIDEMLEEGLVDEVGQLMGMGLDMALPVLKTIGYREVIEHLQGEHDYDEMVRLLKRNSRRYAKRQFTWFRRFPEYNWIDKNAPTEAVIDAVLQMCAEEG